MTFPNISRALKAARHFHRAYGSAGYRYQAERFPTGSIYVRAFDARGNFLTII